MANGDASQIPGQDGGGPPAGPPPGAGGPPGLPGGGPPGGVMAALQQQGGQSPGPTAPGPGDQGDALMKVKMAMEAITQAMPGLGAGTPAYTEAARFLARMGRHLPQGAPTAGVQKTFHKDMGRQMAKNWLMQQVMANQGGGGGPPGGDQGNPMPSTPMPGA